MSYCIEDILKDYGALLSRVASTYEASDSVRQELYQEICVAVWQGLTRFKGDANIKTYILKIAHNRCISHVTKESKAIKSSPLADDLINAQMCSPQHDQHNSINHQYMSVSLEQSISQSQQLRRLLNEVRQLKMPARQ